METAAADTQAGSHTPFVLLLLSIAAIVFSRVYIPNIHYDKLNIIPLAATLYAGYSLIAMKKVCGHFSYVSRCLSEDRDLRKPFGAFLFSPWLRSMLIFLLLLPVAEFGLLCVSSHR